MTSALTKFLAASLFFSSAVLSAPLPRLEATVEVVDPQSLLGKDRSAVLANLDAALSDWARFIDTTARLNIRVEVTSHTGGAGRFTGRSIANRFHHEEGGFRVAEEGATYKLRTGQAIKEGDPDLVMEIQPELMRASYWIDPHPDRRTDRVPPGKTDLVTVFAHELGHAFGINGWIDLTTGNLPANKYISQYDLLMLQGSTSGTPTFVGPETVKVYGGPLPITFFSGTRSATLKHGGRTYTASMSDSQNFRHYGRFAPDSKESDPSFFGLMAGVWVNPKPNQGTRIRVGALDAAILGDLGVPLRKVVVQP